MLYQNRPSKIYYYGEPIDFRKQTMGLATLVDLELPGELMAGHWFVFVSRDKKKAKILYWRGTGLALWQIHLDRDLFKVGSPRFLKKRSFSWRDLGHFLNGLNIFPDEAHEIRKAKRFS